MEALPTKTKVAQALNYLELTSIAFRLPDGSTLNYHRQRGGVLSSIDLNGSRLTTHQFSAGREQQRQQGMLLSQYQYDEQGRLQAHSVSQPWHSDIPAVQEITNGAPIPFVNGQPDFSQWSKGEMEFEPGVLDGSGSDFKAVYKKLQEAMNLNSANAAKLLLKDKDLTPHHHDKVTIQLIPRDLHSNIPHMALRLT